MITLFGMIIVFACLGRAPVYGYYTSVKRTVALPITINFQLLENLVIKKAYTDEGNTAEIVNLNDGCVRITLSEPRYSMVVLHGQPYLRFETKITSDVGTTLFGLSSCLNAIHWEGYIVVYQQPVLDTEKWVMTFQTFESEVLNEKKEKTKFIGAVWETYSDNVYDYINSISVNLAPPLSNFKSFVLPIYPDDLKEQASAFVDSLRLGGAKVDANAVYIEMLADCDEIIEKEKELTRKELSQNEIDYIVSLWEKLDVFVIHLVSTLSEKPLTPEERDVLLAVILDFRYEFVKALDNGDLYRDFVREQFIKVWTGLSPILKNRLTTDPKSSLLSFLGFFTASDALNSLDKIGPSLGIEISGDGLVRLLQMLSVKDAADLNYHMEQNSELQMLLGVEPIVFPESPSENRFNSMHLLDYIIPSAYAAENDTKKPDPKTLKTYLYHGQAVSSYLSIIKPVIDDAIKTKLSKTNISKKEFGLLTLMVYSTAWQETCFRQFLEGKDDITYIRSYNGSSVGLMQINERVWRGLYNIDKLRWDIHYNAAAGVGILESYFFRYALSPMKKNKLTIDNDTLARSVYAMYNGGPGQFTKFLERNASKSYYSSDILFYEKYNWVISGEWDKLSKCLVGG